MNKVVILTEGSKKYGYGHITRCCAFYDIFEENGFFVEFIIQGDTYVREKLKRRNFSLRNWHGAVEREIINQVKCDILIIDSYNITQSDANLFSKLNTKLVVLEDFVRRKYTNAIIIDWSLNAELLDCYKIKERTNTYLLGIDYLVVRKPFRELSNLPKSQGRTEVLITLGGSDIRNLTASIVNNIAIVHPDMRFHIVLGTKIGQKINSNIQNIMLYENLDEKNMARVMQKCHIAISGGGQTLYELAVLNVKIIAIELIENQEEELKSWNTNNLLLGCLKWNDANLIQKINNNLFKYKKGEVKNRLNYVEDRGVASIYDIIIK